MIPPPLFYTENTHYIYGGGARGFMTAYNRWIAVAHGWYFLLALRPKGHQELSGGRGVDQNSFGVRKEFCFQDSSDGLNKKEVVR